MERARWKMQSNWVELRAMLAAGPEEGPDGGLTPPPLRTWILAIPICRLKNFMLYEAGGAFPLSRLRRLLPTNHPKYHGTP